MKKSKILSGIKESSITSEEINKALSDLEKGKSKYGEGKKKQLVAVKTKTGKTAMQVRTVGNTKKEEKQVASFIKKPLTKEEKQQIIESVKERKKLAEEAAKPKDYSSLSVKELYDEQTKLHQETGKYKNILLIGDKGTPEYNQAKSKYDTIWEEIFKVNSFIRRKIDTNDTKKQTEEMIEVPVSKSPADSNKEKVTMKIVKKDGGKYAKSGQRHLEHNGIKQGDKVYFDLGGKRVKGEFRHMNINVHSPKGYYVIIAEVNGKKKLFERKPETVSKLK